MKKLVRIGSRESRLAIAQAEEVKRTIEKYHPYIHAKVVTMKTTGDRILNRSLEKVGGKGLFVKELDQALKRGEIDLAVHSLKDVPMILEDGLDILAYTKREDPRDVLLYKPGRKQIPEKGVIGSASKRRILQLKELNPSWNFRLIRGNVETRIRKLAEEEYDGTVLAASGLYRLGIGDCIGRVFSTEEVIPAAGQGILAVQGRLDEDYFYLKEVDDKKSRFAALAEREFIRILDGGCTSPTAAYAKIEGSSLFMQGLYLDEESGRYVKDNLCGEVGACQEAGKRLAENLKRKCRE